MSPWRVVLVCSWRRLLDDHHSLPFPWTLSLRRRWCPSASHHPVSFLFLLAQSFSLHFPLVSLGRLCQRSPRTFPVLLLCVESTQRRHGRGGGGGTFQSCWEQFSATRTLPARGPGLGGHLVTVGVQWDCIGSHMTPRMPPEAAPFGSSKGRTEPFCTTASNTALACCDLDPGPIHPISSIWTPNPWQGAWARSSCLGISPEVGALAPAHDPTTLLDAIESLSDGEERGDLILSIFPF